MQFLLDITDGFIFLALDIIDLGDIIRHYRTITLFILHDPETFKGFSVLFIPEGQETIIIIGRQVIGIVLDIANRIEKWLGFIKTLQGKIGIALVEFHIGNLPVAQVGDIGAFKIPDRIRKFFFPEIKLPEMIIHHLHTGIIFLHFNKLECSIFCPSLILFEGTNRAVILDFLRSDRSIGLIGFPQVLFQFLQ